MQQYTITMVTFDKALETEQYSHSGNASQHRPQLPKSGFADAHVSQFQIADDDGDFNHINQYQPAENEQMLVDDLIYHNSQGLYGGVLPAGTQISAYHGTIIKDEGGNSFHFMFLRTGDVQGQNLVLVGDRHSAIILPIPRQDEDGNTIWPTFDPSASFTRTGVYAAGTDYPSVPMGPPNDPGDPPCFTLGTLIETADGPMLIEQLQVGDLIPTRDHGLQPIRWIGATHLDRYRLDLQPNLRPIRIAKNALSAGVPTRDLTVSPQHRVLIRSRIAMRMFEQTEVLVAAKHLLGLRGITAQNPALGVTYLHILFDRHEVIRSNGAWSESFFVGPQMVQSGDRRMMAEIATLFPDLLSRPPARRMLSGRESRQLTLRHAKNNRDLVLPHA